MSWLFSQVLVEEFLGENCLDGEQSVQLSGNPIQQAYCAPDKMTDFSRLSRFGMMFKPLTENLGEELLMSFRAAFHAKICQLPIKTEMGLTEKEADYGKKWQGLLAKLDPSSFLWKTAQCSLLEDLEQSFQTFPKWGSMQNGACWEQIPLVLTTDEKEFGYLPTPTASDQYNGNKIGITYKNKRFIRTIWGEADGFLSVDQWKEFTSKLCRVDDELASRVDKLKAIGNGQVPQVAATAWNILKGRLDERL